MNELSKVMGELATVLSPYIIPIVSAGVAFVVAWLKSKTLTTKVGQLEEALKKVDEEYYIICPSCGTKVSLAKVKIYLAQQSDITTTD